MTHAPYRGAAPAFIDLIPGRIDCYFGSGELLTYSRSGQVRVLALDRRKRVRRRSRNCRPSPRPASPAMWSTRGRAMFAPAKTPPDIVQQNQRRYCQSALPSRHSSSKLAHTAYTAASSSPDELREFSENRHREMERRHQDRRA